MPRCTTTTPTASSCTGGRRAQNLARTLPPPPERPGGSSRYEKGRNPRVLQAQIDPLPSLGKHKTACQSCTAVYHHPPMWCRMAEVLTSEEPQKSEKDTAHYEVSSQKVQRQKKLIPLAQTLPNSRGHLDVGGVRAVVDGRGVVHELPGLHLGDVQPGPCPCLPTPPPGVGEVTQSIGHPQDSSQWWARHTSSNTAWPGCQPSEVHFWRGPGWAIESVPRSILRNQYQSLKLKSVHANVSVLLYA